MKTDLNIQKVGQIAIAISDLAKSIVFYQDILGLPLLFQAPPGLAFFDCGGTRLMLTTLQGSEKDHHTSAIYYQVDNMQTAADALIGKGIQFERPPQLAAKMEDYDLWLGFLRDPDDNLVGLMAEVPTQT